MTSLVVDRLRGRRECGIGERPHRNGNRIGPPLGLPKNCRAAIRAKVKVNRKPGIGASSISPKVSIRLNVLASEKCGYAVRATCSPLAIQTMTHRNLDRIASTCDAESPASAGRGSCGHDPSPPNLVLQGGASQSARVVRCTLDSCRLAAPSKSARPGQFRTKSSPICRDDLATQVPSRLGEQSWSNGWDRFESVAPRVTLTRQRRC